MTKTTDFPKDTLDSFAQLGASARITGRGINKETAQLLQQFPELNKAFIEGAIKGDQKILEAVTKVATRERET